MSAASTDGSGLRGWAGRLAGPLLFLVSLAGAAAISFFVVSALDDDGDDAAEGSANSLLSTYEVPVGEAGEGAVAAIYGPDEERQSLPVSTGSSAGGGGGAPGGGGGDADDQADSEESGPATPEDGGDATGTPDPDETVGETETTPEGEDAGDGAPEITVDVDLDPRPDGIELLPDICALDPSGPGCPDGIPGTVIGGDESPEDEDSGTASEALTAGDLSARALVSLDSSDPDYRVHEGCTPPDSTSISLLIESSQRLYNRVAYWPVRFLPGGGSEATAAASTVELWSDFERDGAVFPFYKCARLEMGTGTAFEVQIRAMDVDGNTIWTPIYDFCRECPIFVGDLSLEDATAFTIEPHADWAAAIVDDPPGDGSLEFAYRLPDTERWASTLQGGLAGGEVVRLLTGHRLLPGTEYEYRLTYHTNEPDVTFVSEIGRFTTLRRTVLVSMSRFEVVEGGDLDAVSFYFCPFAYGTDSLDFCAYSGRPLAGQDPPQISIEGTRRLTGGVGGGGSGLEVEEGDRVLINFDPPQTQLTSVVGTEFGIGFVAQADRNEPDGSWKVNFRIPPWFAGAGEDSCGADNTFGLRTSPIQRGLVEPIHQSRPGDGPYIRPLDLEVCVIEVP